MKKQKEMIRAVVLFMVLSFMLPPASSTSDSPTPVCAGSQAPVMLTEPLEFCGHTGVSCCNAMDDAKLREQFEDMNISDGACAAIVQAFICSRCIPSLSALLFHSADPATTTKLSVPLLCASAPPRSTAQQTRSPQRQHSTVCLERISAGSFLGMAAHPDGSDRVFLSSRDGKIWLAMIPERGSGRALRVDDDHLFLDLRDRVLGLVSVAFHPEYAANGRFFVSYNCDSHTSPACGTGSRSWGEAAGSRSCRYKLVVAEFSAIGGADYSEATRAHPSEVRRIFTMCLPELHTSYSYQQHGGQILFQPSDSDGYLYLITGHGDFSKNGSSFLGKTIRFDVGSMAGQRGGTNNRGARKMDKPEMFSTGLNNPSGCSFDSERPSHLYCANVDQQQKEKVYLITNKAGSHSTSPSNAVSFTIINHGHAADGRMPSIVGGLIYRGYADPSLTGRYLYIYASTMRTSTVEAPGGSKSHSRQSSQIPNLRCSSSSPVPCRGRGTAILGRVQSFNEDNSKDAFIFTTRGVYRVVPPGVCRNTPQPPQWPPGTSWVLSHGVLAMLFALYLIWSIIFGGGTSIEMRCCNGLWSRNNYHYYRNGEHQE